MVSTQEREIWRSRQKRRKTIVAAALKPSAMAPPCASATGRPFPEVGESTVAAFVWSRTPKIVDAFDRGVVIRSARALFLAIPTATAGKSGRSAIGLRERTIPDGWQRRTRLKLRFVCEKRSVSTASL